MQVGKHTYGHTFINIIWGNPSQIQIGSFCSIASGCVMVLGGNHRVDWVTTYPFGHIQTNIFNTFNGNGHPSSKGGIIVGNDVWIGMNSTILSGVNIGNGAVVGCNSVVTKDVPPYAVVAGNPARVVKYRFSEENINKLQEIAWWNWSDDKINSIIPLLCNKDINKFIEYCEEN